ncbi:TPA: siphovirus Gp157 family protein [Bacillus cereus]|uniref:Gp157 family protein n=1 Tax=Bacillus phage vB_BtS_BMBtp2 TaxID=2884431 RepID=K4LRS9_9CAUD|nr:MULTISPECIES: siphovirus Gp157 family protein [Bacillus]YP_007236369.1 Mu Gam-like end protection [Bacillus phage vB_BtS_BMBtp2]AGV99371.1 Gp157 family protein [Bacillus phage proCM3]HDR6245219.1 siphovirus Gp157 family protein [Bacillus cereus]AFV15404.1 Gp157 family protein [Bacillus phage vB_BtS_BMBtp2]AJQ58642.1 hypothetical protein SD98_10140 [Bacillus thuringiensis serovar morrisoni]MED3098642.1 siphovirus Gp157 family protein [Bacillus thuringiensis]
MTTSLYSLTGKFLEIQQYITEDNQEMFTDTLEAIDEAIEQKALGIVHVVKNLETMCETIKAEETRLAERRKRTEKSVERLKQYLLDSMEATDNKKIETDLMTISIRNNKESLLVHSEAFIPEMYYKPGKPSLDKTNLLKAVQKGIIVEGVTTHRTKSLSIK